MTWILPYLGPAAAYLAIFVGGGFAYHYARKFVRNESVDQFKGAAEPFMTAIAPLTGLPEDVRRLGDAVRGVRNGLDALRSQMEGIAQTANTAHSMAVEALKASAAATATAAATSSQLSTHVNRFPHTHQNGAGYGEP